MNVCFSILDAVSFASLRNDPNRTYGIQVKGNTITMDFSVTHLICDCDTPALAAEWVQMLQDFILDKK